MKFIHTLLIVTLLFSLVATGQAFEKTVLVEYFTNVNCGPCAGQSGPIEDMLNNYTRDEIAFICYHVSWPSPQDGYYVGNPTENTGRRNYYGFNSVPWFEIEGLWHANGLNTVLQNGVNRIGTYTPYQIEFGAWPEPGATVPITATLTCAEAAFVNMRFNIVLIDKEQVIPPGSNGIDDYCYNMLDMAFSYTGETFTTVGGNEELVFEYTFDIPANNTFGNLAVVAYVQDYATKEIFQSAFIAGPEVVIHGTVEHAVTGLPMWLAVVQLNGGDDGQAITGQDGGFHFGGLVEGDYVIDVFMSGYEQLTTESEFFEYGTHELTLGMTNSHENIDMVSGVGAGGNVYDAFEVSDIAYIAAGNDGLLIYNIADFENIDELGSLDLGDEIFDVIVDGDYAFVSGANGVYSVNVSIPGSPLLESTVTTSSSVFNIAMDGTHIYGAGASAGLVVINAATPGDLSLVTEFDTPGYARDIVMASNFALIADGASGLTILDIGTPGSPFVEGSLATDGYTSGIAMEGAKVYIADDQQGVKIINVLNPNDPQLIAGFEGTGRAKQVDVNNDTLFVAEDSEGFFLYDVSNATNVQQLGYSETPGTTTNVSIVGVHAYVADSDWMLMFDVSGNYVSIEEGVETEALPVAYEMENAYPNPFNPSTTVNVNLPNPADLSVSVYNVLGQQIAVLANGPMNAGHHAFTFDAHNLTSGLYFIRATVPGELNSVQKIMLVR